MAGTRLVIQATLFVELVVLLFVAAYFGLCKNKDVICSPILAQGGRSLLAIPPEWNEKQVFKSEEKHTKLRRRYKLHVTLILEQGSEWNEWAPAMDTVLHERNLANHACLVGEVETELLLEGNLSDNARTVVNNANNMTEFRISGSTVKTWLTSRRHHFGGSRLDVLLYVPQESKSPLLFKLKDMEPTSALTWERTLVTIVERSSDGDDSASNNKIAMTSALAFLDPFLKDQCQLSSNSTEWWQQLTHDSYERAKEKVLINHDILSKSSLKVAITKEVAQRWRKSMELVDESVHLAQQGNYEHAVVLLEESLSISDALLADPTLMEPIDMQNDHYMAVFFPLVFPLLLPFLAGLIREVKRYRKLKRDKESSKKES